MEGGCQMNERLKEIVVYEHTTSKGRHYVGFKSKEYYERFIQQAERAEELKKEIEGRKKFELGTASNLNNLREQNQHYRQVLGHLLFTDDIEVLRIVTEALKGE